MIVFKKVRWKNFLSTGNNFIEVGLDKNHTTLVVGENGAGKSTILDALSFSLFNRPFRSVKKEQLINSINLGGTEVEVEFQIGSKEYKVCRGIKPNKFEIYVDGDMIDQNATTIDYQKYLEQNILKINSKTFNQVVILGSSSFTPFMQLKNAYRRDVIEEILDIKVFSIMNILAKQKQKESNLKNLHFINGDIHDYSEIASEVVILSNVLEHIEDRVLFLKNVQKLSGAKTFLVRVPYFKRDWQIAFRKKFGIYYFSDIDHKIEHTLEELEKELGDANLIMKETITDWGEIWTKCEYEF